MKKYLLYILLLVSLVYSQTSEPPLSFPVLDHNKDVPNSIKALHYKKGLSEAVQELDRVIAENSTLSSYLTTMIVAVVASRNKCLY